MHAPGNQKRYLHPTSEAVEEFSNTVMHGDLVMLNLLKFRQIADYSETPRLAPAEPISGRAAFRLYVEHTMPFLEKSGGVVLFYGEGAPYLIGPTDEKWDRIFLIRHNRIEDFLKYALDEDYLAGIGHRTAALSDSRLMPIENLRREYD